CPTERVVPCCRTAEPVTQDLLQGPRGKAFEQVQRLALEPDREPRMHGRAVDELKRLFVHAAFLRFRGQGAPRAGEKAECGDRNAAVAVVGEELLECVLEIETLPGGLQAVAARLGSKDVLGE